MLHVQHLRIFIRCAQYIYIYIHMYICIYTYVYIYLHISCHIHVYTMELTNIYSRPQPAWPQMHTTFTISLCTIYCRVFRRVYQSISTLKYESGKRAPFKNAHHIHDFITLIERWGAGVETHFQEIS